MITILGYSFIKSMRKLWNETSDWNKVDEIKLRCIVTLGSEVCKNWRQNTYSCIQLKWVREKSAAQEITLKCFQCGIITKLTILIMLKNYTSSNRFAESNKKKYLIRRSYDISESILIKVICFIGRYYFQTSVARQLKERNHGQLIDYKIPVYQPYEVLQLDNNINRIFLPNEDVDESVYDKVFTLPPCTQEVPPTIQYQKHCGVKELDPRYEIKVPQKHN